MEATSSYFMDCFGSFYKTDSKLHIKCVILIIFTSFSTLTKQTDQWIVRCVQMRILILTKASRVNSTAT